MPLPPLTFTPILKPRAWGGHTLHAFGKDAPHDALIGESWEIADLPESIPDGRSVIADGPLAGQTLHGLLRDDAHAVLGRAAPGPDGSFPLLVKILDARENLSVQLHPSPAYAAAHPEAYLKTEAWVILAAEDGALVHVGLKPEVDRAMFENALSTGEVRSLLTSMPVKPGDCVFLESGLCHALGEGILAAEIQLPSDTTFRVWDWNRNDPNRPLHIQEAIASIRLGAEQHTAWPIMTHRQDARTTSANDLEVRLLVRSPCFTIEELTPTPTTQTTVSFPFPTNGLPHVFLAARGEAIVEASGASITLSAGQSALLPADAEDPHIHLKVRDNTPSSLIHAVPPDPLDNVLANS